MVPEMEAVAAVLKKYDVTVYRPELIENCNQIFSKRHCFCSYDDKMVKANILPDRANEFEAIRHVWETIPKDKRVTFPEECHVEGGDVMPRGDYLFVGTYTGEDYPSYITARTNDKAVKALQAEFPNRIVKAFELRKSNTVARDNALHLDCCFQPIGHDKCIIHKEGFLNEQEYLWLVNHFGVDNCFHIDKDEMYNMFSNVFSIAPDVVISEQTLRASIPGCAVTALL